MESYIFVTQNVIINNLKSSTEISDLTKIEFFWLNWAQNDEKVALNCFSAGFYMITASFMKELIPPTNIQ